MKCLTCKSGIGEPYHNGVVMLSRALQRNAKHEARLSNISGYACTGSVPKTQRFFASLRMTVIRWLVTHGFRSSQAGIDRSRAHFEFYRLEHGTGYRVCT